VRTKNDLEARKEKLLLERERLLADISLIESELDSVQDEINQFDGAFLGLLDAIAEKLRETT